MSLLPRQRILHVAIDAVLVAAAWYLAFQLRFDLETPPKYELLLEKTLPLVVVVKTIVFVLAGLYPHWWRYVSIRDMWSAARAVTIASLVVLLAVYVWDPVGYRVPSGVVVMDWLLLLALVAGTRLLARTIVERPAPRRMFAAGKDALVVGAGDAGRLIVREMLRNPKLGYTPIGLVDDDRRKRNLKVHGVRVLGTTRDLRYLLRDHSPDEVIIALPSAAGKKREEIVNVCRDVGVAVKTLPAVHELISGDVTLARRLREVQVEDILGREPVRLDTAAVASYLERETVLVTGAGGSIGSELCRQVAAIGPECLVLVERSETALADIARELGHDRGSSAVVPVLGDVRDRAKMHDVFERYRPAVVFHAAAYKHVPIVEANAIESVRNNVLATKVIAEVASEAAAKSFVLVSTDKAVNPKSVLGQTKAVCEWIVAAAAAKESNGTRFLSVRFGNVLGSSGSVVQLFRRQIASGGPLTVTHEDMTRYFMTIPEAAQLIIQAGAIGEGGDVFVLDMGTPVKIVDLARNMIRLSGQEPDRDIAIEFVGPRPGEKLHEELWDAGESAAPTSHPKILRCAWQPVDFAWLDEELAELERLAEDGATLEAVQKLREMVTAPKRAGAPAAEAV